MTREELRDYVDEQRTLNNIPYSVYSALIDGIDTLEQESKTGHWAVYAELTGEWEGTKKYACDKCGEKVGVFKSNFCPNCGAKMIEQQKSEDNNEAN